jgi:hypothetical protein
VSLQVDRGKEKKKTKKTARRQAKQSKAKQARQALYLKSKSKSNQINHGDV